MDGAEIFTQLTRQNALRRETGLPLYNIREEFEQRVASEEWRVYRNYRYTYKDLYARFEREVHAEWGITNVQTVGTFSKMGIVTEVSRRFYAELERRGIRRPKSTAKNPIVYGDKK